MLYASRVSHQLEANVERFRAFAETERAAFHTFDRPLAMLDRLDFASLQDQLAEENRPGALPSEEWQPATGLIQPFAVSFEHHRAARRWALECISGVTTIAADGSEIKPTKDYSLPIAAVQVGWFENPHCADRPYVKDATFEVVDPTELTAEAGDGFGIAEQHLALRRFQLEVEVLIARMASLAERGWTGQRPPVAFFDGSLVVSFTAVMLERLGSQYIQSICELIRASEETGIPVVGYVDTSLAKDLATLLAVLAGLPRPQRMPDSRLLDQRMQWGDRTRALVCARADVLSRYLIGEASYAREICFTYLKTNQAAPPSRLDIPRWVVRQGLLEHVIDVVRSEVIVGNGYPYCLETADACAVLSALDRERFYRILQDFAGRHGLGLSIVPKAASKRRRRI